MDIDEEKTILNPWKKPIMEITLGFALTSITLNFLWLQYILPAIGTVLIFIGVRSLRKENKYFTMAYFLAASQLVINAINLIIISTPLVVEIQNDIIFSLLLIGFRLALFLSLSSAIRNIFLKANVSNIQNSFFLAFVWILSFSLLAISPLSNSWIAFILLTFFCILVIRSLQCLGDELGNIGYGIISIEDRLSNTVVVRGYLIICLVLVISCGVTANHAVPKFTEIKSSTASDTQNILMEFDVPEEILNDMSYENISMLQNAIHVDVYTDLLMFDGVSEMVEIGTRMYKEYIKPKNRTIEATTVYTELPDNEIYVLVYFKWQKPKAFWNDGFTIWGEEGIELLDGKLFYQKDGIDYEASIPRLKNDFVTTESMFFGASQSKQISGGVCYPFGSENQRGYVFYRLKLSEEQGIVPNCINYLHSKNPISLPYTFAEQKILSGHREYKQHYTTYDLKKYQDMQE
ncbi:hypothetical protein [Sedimentibacter sp. B4]|uniref:hypothetical protein n=1 Tax=Sedimentibacter sp. B4 TaxID=304766 RepID=UPI0002F0EC48|nr:hypothetical protein [Sedimentibacter sp. B4]